MASSELVNAYFSKAAQQCGFRERGFLCFEEDCAATVALRELMDRKLFHAPVNQYYGPGEYEQSINRSVRRYYPDYWSAREMDRAQIRLNLDQPPVKHKAAER